ncbi:hypothetical protein L1987_34226 [Smallanthus sonchifolius]|uniref:Uncharacterized protein n=1 Tax=Smallanthus sonchifolius TaxID=185202 RepID=A0ACB9HUR2_9ASTR|nr:hypothetical protein L1987_34226 [Smallanthus sonchifolius]
MRHRNFDKVEGTQAVTLRRSPRFFQLVLSDSEDPKTPKPEQHRRTRIRSSRRRRHRSKSEESCNARRIPNNSKTMPRRSRRLNRCADEWSIGGISEFERRVTRSCGGFNVYTSPSFSSGDGSVKLSKHSKGKSLKNKVKLHKRSWDNNLDRIDTLAFDGNTNEGVLSITEKQVLDEELSQKQVAKITNGIDVCKMQKNIGVNRSRNLFNTLGITQGWTKDQELALERAYLQAKPTPHFWKKVSRLVPGKSAQECFDKIHGSHLTPPQPRIRSRARVNSQNSTFSASKLLTKRPKYRKQKSHIIQRTVRHMLQNQYKVKQDSESDLFSVLEPTFRPSSNLNMMLTTPDRSQETDEALTRSSTVHKKSVSRFNSSYGTTLVSPPVLKPVKNKALHEKYIDLLNCREASRKVASAKAEKVNKSEVVKQESSVERKNAIKAAKNALVFCAKDAINEFQHHQATMLSDVFYYESDGDADEDNDQVFF